MPEEKSTATLDTPVDELEQKLVDETDIDELKNIINLFNLNIKKKDILRTSKLSDLQDKVTAQMGERLENNAGAFSNKDLIEYFKIIQDTINKADNSLSTVDTPAIQLNQNQLNVHINHQNELDKDSRDRVADAVKSILARLEKEKSSQEVIDVEYTEMEENSENVKEGLEENL
ncbi:MAG: hypothetical protein SPJ27_02510 [Candidatus Onthovivens sp.]|nr:hypothetical protein [Candidatus Onthovivens sp.]